MSGNVSLEAARALRDALGLPQEPPESEEEEAARLVPYTWFGYGHYATRETDYFPMGHPAEGEPSGIITDHELGIINWGERLAAEYQCEGDEDEEGGCEWALAPDHLTAVTWLEAQHGCAVTRYSPLMHPAAVWQVVKMTPDGGLEWSWLGDDLDEGIVAIAAHHAAATVAK